MELGTVKYNWYYHECPKHGRTPFMESVMMCEECKKEMEMTTEQKIKKVLYRTNIEDFENEINEVNMTELASYISAELDFENGSEEDEMCFEIVADFVDKY